MRLWVLVVGKQCFEVCFELENKGKKITDRAGLLIYFGVGVKGLGGVEMRELYTTTFKLSIFDAF